MKDKLSKQLTGFRKNHSTQHCLSCMLEIWKKVLDKGGYICAISMDLSKAFDTVNHDLLIAKLGAYGFETDAPRYIKSNLTNRKKRAKVNKTFSEWERITTCVLQGSILVSSSNTTLIRCINAPLNSFSITEKDILVIIKSLDPNKSHGWDNISIKMIKMCGESLALPLKMIFEAALNDGVFPDDWKKGNIALVHKKDLKTMLINCHPINLLPIFAKIFEKMIFTSMFEYL